MACVRLDVSVNLPADLLFLPLIVNFASPLRPHRTMRPAAKTYGMTRRALISILAFACTMTVPVAGVVPADIPTAVSRVDSMLVEARCHLGKRYKYGAAGSESFDCSGYTSYVFGRYGYKLARSSRGQADAGACRRTRLAAAGRSGAFRGAGLRAYACGACRHSGRGRPPDGRFQIHTRLDIARRRQSAAPTSATTRNVMSAHGA